MALDDSKKKNILQKVIGGISQIPGQVAKGVGDYWKMLNPSKVDLAKRYPKVTEMARRKNLYGDTSKQEKALAPNTTASNKTAFGKMRESSVGAGYPVPPSK